MKVFKIEAISVFGFVFLVCVFKEYSYSISHKKTCLGRLCLGSENGICPGRGGNHCVGCIFVPESIRQRLISYLLAAGRRQVAHPLVLPCYRVDE